MSSHCTWHSSLHADKTPLKSIKQSSERLTEHNKPVQEMRLEKKASLKWSDFLPSLLFQGTSFNLADLPERALMRILSKTLAELRPPSSMYSSPASPPLGTPSLAHSRDAARSVVIFRWPDPWLIQFQPAIAQEIHQKRPKIFPGWPDERKKTERKTKSEWHWRVTKRKVRRWHV